MYVLYYICILDVAYPRETIIFAPLIWVFHIWHIYFIMKARIIYKICLYILTYKAPKFGEPVEVLKWVLYLVPFGLETSVAVRHSNDWHRLFEPRTIRSSGERSFQYSAPRLYNKLPVVIKHSENINQFRKRLKTYLFGESYDMNQKL